MKKRPIKSLKLPPSSAYVIVLLIGFGAGFTIREFIPFDLKPTIPQPPYSACIENLNSRSLTVCFTPNKQCQYHLIELINKTKESIYVQAYSFTDREIAEALVTAAKRGIKVKVLLDKSNKNDHRSAKDLMINNNIPLRFDYPPGIAHNKVMVIDQATIVSGSYNFSVSAYKRNTENLLIINDKPLAQKYIENWAKRWQLSDPQNR